MSKGYLYDNGDELITREEALPDSSEASVGDVLSLDSDKEPVWSTPESELPSTGSASVGDVLTLDEDKEPVWSAPSGGGDSSPLIVKATGTCTIDTESEPGYRIFSVGVDKTSQEISSALDPASYKGVVVLFPSFSALSTPYYNYNGFFAKNVERYVNSSGTIEFEDEGSNIYSFVLSGSNYEIIYTEESII